MSGFCPSCGKALPDHVKFCPSCGAPVASEVLKGASQGTQQNAAVNIPPEQPGNNGASFGPQGGPASFGGPTMNQGETGGLSFEQLPTYDAVPESSWSDIVFKTRGRLNRKRYFIRTLIIELALNFILYGIVFGSTDSFVTMLFVNLMVSLFLIPVAIRRLHDLNHSGPMILIRLIPIIGLFFALYLLFAAGTPGKNQYGPDPLLSPQLYR